MTGHEDTAEDLTQEVFMKVYHSAPSYQPRAKFKTWLYQIARNRVIDYYREKKLTVALEEVENTLEYHFPSPPISWLFQTSSLHCSSTFWSKSPPKQSDFPKGW